MKTPKSKPSVNKQIYEEAAEWLVELRVGDVDAEARERLDAWFRESPHHIRAFLELSSIWEDGGDPDLDRAHSTDELIARARSVTNVVSLDRESSPTTLLHGESAQDESAIVARRFPRRSVWAASIVGASLVATLGVWLYSQLPPNYATRVGEEKSISLPDGSTLELNSRSQVRVRFSEHERDVDLVEGQALFHVAKDAARPFVVHSGSAQVRAVGTQFDVYRKASGTIVTVVEGRVAVLPTQTNSPLDSKSPSGSVAPVFDAVCAVLLVAGEQIRVAPSAPSKPRKTDVAAATAWTQHQFVFDSTPLEDVAQEFNRYNVRQLIVSDRLTDFHVTGVFSSTDPASLLRFLRAQRGLNVEETDKEIRVSKK